MLRLVASCVVSLITYQFEKVSNAIATLKNSNFIITGQSSLSPSDMRQLLRRIAREHGGIGMVLADYMQLMAAIITGLVMMN